MLKDEKWTENEDRAVGINEFSKCLIRIYMETRVCVTVGLDRCQEKVGDPNIQY